MVLNDPKAPVEVVLSENGSEGVIDVYKRQPFLLGLQLFLESIQGGSVEDSVGFLYMRRCMYFLFRG